MVRDIDYMSRGWTLGNNIFRNVQLPPYPEDNRQFRKPLLLIDNRLHRLVESFCSWFQLGMKGHKCV